MALCVVSAVMGKGRKECLCVNPGEVRDCCGAAGSYVGPQELVEAYQIAQSGGAGVQTVALLAVINRREEELGLQLL